MKILILIVFATLLPAQQFQSWFPVNPPTLSAFSWVNQQSATWAAPNGLPVFTVPYHASPANWDSVTQALPSPPYTLTLVFAASYPSYGIFNFGITLQDANGKAENLMLSYFNAPGQFIVYQEGNASVYSGFENAVFTGNLPNAQIRGLRIQDTGTTRTFSYSADGGTTWAPQYSEPTNSYLTPVKWGLVGVNLMTGSTVSAVVYDLGITTP